MTVTIIGAGPAGLTLASILQKRGVSARIFEHDASFEARDQGGTIDLHEHSGQKAIFEAGLINEFNKHSRPEGEELTVMDKHGNIALKEEASATGNTRPEIDRKDLRKILFDSLEPGTITWGKHIMSVESTEDGCCKLNFKDGTSELADFLVGADGTWSKVRGLISSNKPVYSGVTMVEFHILNPSSNAPHISSLVGEGSAMILSDDKALMAQRNGDKSIRVYAAQKVPEDWASHYDFSNTAEIRKELFNIFQDWQPELLQMIALCEDKFVPRPLYELPLEQWETFASATVIGDAAHVMTPFGGQGANIAMFDALELANCITSDEFKKSQITALKTFEDKMFANARRSLHITKLGLAACLSPNAPNTFVELMNRFHQGPPPQA